MASGDDVKAGNITAAEKTTVLLAQVPTGDPTPFNGQFILEVAPQLAGETKPNQTIDAIKGTGANSGGPIPASPGGTG